MNQQVTPYVRDGNKSADIFGHIRNYYGLIERTCIAAPSASSFLARCSDSTS